MKKLILIAALLGGMSCQAAYAKIHTFDYTAQLFDISTPQGWSMSVPGVAPGSVINFTDILKARFTFDDLGTTSENFDFQSRPAINLSFTFADGTKYTETNPVWEISPPQYALAFTIGTNWSDSKPVRTSVSIDVGDPNVSQPFNIVDHFSVPGMRSRIQMRIGENDLTFFGLSLEPVAISPVPEPSTYAMLLLGAAVVGGAAKRRAARQKAIAA